MRKTKNQGGPIEILRDLAKKKWFVYCSLLTCYNSNKRKEESLRNVCLRLGSPNFTRFNQLIAISYRERQHRD